MCGSPSPLILPLPHGRAGSADTAGITQEELDASMLAFASFAEQIGAVPTLLRTRHEACGVAADYLLRMQLPEDDFMDVRIAVVGNVDAGKSTLLGVLTHGTCSRWSTASCCAR
jgi:GTPase